MEAAKVEAENLQHPQGYAKSQKQKTKTFVLAYLAADPSEGARTMFEGEVKVDLAFDVGLAADLEFELDVKSICELGRLSPPLGSRGDDFSSLNFIPSPDPTPTLSPVLSNSTTHRHSSTSQAPEYSMSKQSTSA